MCASSFSNNLHQPSRWPSNVATGRCCWINLSRVFPASDVRVTVTSVSCSSVDGVHQVNTSLRGRSISRGHAELVDAGPPMTLHVLDIKIEDSS